MRIWVDLTNSPHVLVMRPIIAALQEDGHEVEVTARDFAQTLELLRRFEIAHQPIGSHRGERRSAKALGLASRSLALARWAQGREGRFDLAMGHGSNDVSVAAALLRIRSATMFDYEYAALQHHINCRLARSVVVPDAIAPERLARYGATGKLARYEGLKEEYYLADFEPDPLVPGSLGITGELPLVLVRTPPDLALYHRFDNDLFGELLSQLDVLCAAGRLQAIVLPRTAAQRRELAGLSSLIVPAQAVDAQSLVAYSRLVISAGGTMNREAAALGVPVISTFQGRLGAVDERLIAEGRLTLLSERSSLQTALRQVTEPVEEARGPTHAPASRTRRDVRVLVKLLLQAPD